MLKTYKIDEINSLLALFMGATVQENAYSVMEDIGQNGKLYYFKENTSMDIFRHVSQSGLKYTSDMRWLWSVIDRFIERGWNVTFTKDSVTAERHNVKTTTDLTKFEYKYTGGDKVVRNNETAQIANLFANLTDDFDI